MNGFSFIEIGNNAINAIQIIITLSRNSMDAKEIHTCKTFKFVYFNRIRNILMRFVSVLHLPLFTFLAIRRYFRDFVSFLKKFKLKDVFNRVERNRFAGKMKFHFYFQKRQVKWCSHVRIEGFSFRFQIKTDHDELLREKKKKFSALCDKNTTISLDTCAHIRWNIIKYFSN